MLGWEWDSRAWGDPEHGREAKSWAQAWLAGIIWWMMRVEPLLHGLAAVASAGVWQAAEPLLGLLVHL